jgi:hypothetical protein
MSDHRSTHTRELEALVDEPGSIDSFHRSEPENRIKKPRECELDGYVRQRE